MSPYHRDTIILISLGTDPKEILGFSGSDRKKATQRCRSAFADSMMWDASLYVGWANLGSHPRM